MRRFDQGEGEERIANLDGKTGALEPVEHGENVHLLPLGGRPTPPDVVIRDQASKDDDENPDQEGHDGERFDRSPVNERVFPLLLVPAEFL